MYDKIIEMADALADKLITYRRDLHRHAETGWLEMRTSSLVAARLKALGYEVLTGKQVCKAQARMGLPSQEILEEHYQWAAEHGADEEFLPHTRGGFTGVIGILRCGDGPTAALRFDMDALGVFEETDSLHRPFAEHFCSISHGMMHACGHDGHTAIGLGTAELLSEFKDSLHGTVKLIFQPAEEGLRGAKAIVENGHLDDVDYVMGGHLTDSEDSSLCVCPGMAGTLASTKLDAVFMGKSAHAGSDPQEGCNALLAAASAVLNLQAIPRHGDGASRINVGTLHAGSGRNVICDTAKMELEVRGQTTEINSYMEGYARAILEHTASMHGCTVEIKEMGSAAAMECTSAFTQEIGRVCSENLHLSVRTPKPLGGSEDYAYMTKRVIDRGGQACFIGIQIPCMALFHNKRFDFDERALPLGVKVYTGMIWRLLGER